MDLKRTASELYNKGIIKAREVQEEQQRAKGFKVAIVVEREDGRRLLINTHGVKGHVQLDDYDEERIRKFLGHNLGSMRTALKTGKRYSDQNERVSFEFSAPAKQPIKLPSLRLSAPKRVTSSRIVSSKPQKRGYYSPSLGRWVDL